MIHISNSYAHFRFTFQREIENCAHDGKKNQLARKVNTFRRETVCSRSLTA